MELSVELYTENGNTFAYVAMNDGASGAKYRVNNADDIGKAVSKYINNYYPDLIKEVVEGKY